MSKLKVFSMFDGVGGFIVGLDEANKKLNKKFFQVTDTNQFEPSRKAQDAFEVGVYNYPKINHSNEDIMQVSSEYFDEMRANGVNMIVGGFPCQDYSVARSKKHEMGIEGKKGVLFWEIIRAVNHIKPEYLILPASFGFWMMMMTMYIFSTRNGCNFITWIQKRLFGKRKNEIAFQPMTRHTSIVTFMEVNMILWASYLLLMFCYDKNFLGDHHPVTFLVGIGCFIGALYMLKKQLYIASWGANIRMAIATVIVFWTPVEILGRINFFKEFWVHPQEYAVQLLCILAAFILLIGYMWLKGSKKKQNSK